MHEDLISRTLNVVRTSSLLTMEHVRWNLLIRLEMRASGVLTSTILLMSKNNCSSIKLSCYSYCNHVSVICSVDLQKPMATLCSLRTKIRRMESRSESRNELSEHLYWRLIAEQDTTKSTKAIVLY